MKRNLLLLYFSLTLLAVDLLPDFNNLDPRVTDQMADLKANTKVQDLGIQTLHRDPITNLEGFSSILCIMQTGRQT